MAWTSAGHRIKTKEEKKPSFKSAEYRERRHISTSLRNVGVEDFCIGFRLRQDPWRRREVET